MWESCDEARPPAGQDPDVVGLGTLIACAGSACIAVVCLAVQYLFFYIPRTEDEQQSCVASPIDILLLGGLRKPLEYLGIKFGWSTAPGNKGRRWPAAFDQYITAVGDVQLATGFAVLTYGYVSLMDQGLSMYNWWLIVGLVWFSVVTNLATTSYLRTYYVNKDPGERWWRGFLLVCLIAMLSFSMVPIYQMKERLADEHDEDAKRTMLTTTNVLCYLPGRGARIDTPQFLSALALIGIAVVVGIAMLGILRLFERPSSVIFRWRDHYRGEMRQSFFGDGENIITCIRCEQRHMLLVVRPILAFWLVLRIYADFLNSVLTEVVCASATFAWLAVRFVDVLRLGGSFEVNSQRWGFGQIVTLAFFAAPFGSLAGCLFGSLRGLSFGKGPFRRPESRKFNWFSKFAKRAQPEQVPEPRNDVDEHSNQSESVRTEGPAGSDGKDGKDSVEPSPKGQEERNNLEEDQDDALGRMYDVGNYKVLLSPRFVIALPLVGFSNLLHLVLLLVLPKVSGYPLTADVLWRTIFWYVVYQPLLLFAFFLAGMIVEERVTREGRMRCAYRIIGAITAVLSAVAIMDTLYGLGGIPMSYIGMGTLGLVLLVYLLYGCVARPGPLAKGKGRSRYSGGGDEGDVEEGQPLLSESGRKILPDVRIFPVRKQKRWHGPSRRPQVSRGRRSYGTIE
ncbi:hypothetical protein F4677DRAFT_134744 [Hypoxylon crocopeplum]|nr:hypothetical protein F4677DRAFT_134744 [Hypoxylon crocopeplum]